MREKGGSGSLVGISSCVSHFISSEIKSCADILVRIAARFPGLLCIYVSFYLFAIFSGLGMVEYFYFESEVSVSYSNSLPSTYFALRFHFVIALGFIFSADNSVKPVPFS